MRCPFLIPGSCSTRRTVVGCRSEVFVALPEAGTWSVDLLLRSELPCPILRFTDLNIFISGRVCSGSCGFCDDAEVVVISFNSVCTRHLYCGAGQYEQFFPSLISLEHSDIRRAWS